MDQKPAVLFEGLDSSKGKGVNSSVAEGPLFYFNRRSLTDSQRRAVPRERHWVEISDYHFAYFELWLL